MEMINSKKGKVMVVDSQDKIAPVEDDEKSVEVIERLSKTEKNELRKKAHSLKPVVLIGQHDVNDAVIAEIDVSLDAHELVKIRCRGSDKEKLSEQSTQVKNRLHAEIVQKIDSTFVLYRKKTTSS